MKSGYKRGISRRRDAGTGKASSLSEDLLASEIRFWREMIETMGESDHSRESAERMRQALALAEYRLAHAGDSAAAPARVKRTHPSSH